MKKINIFIILATNIILKASISNPNIRQEEISRPETTISRPSLSVDSIRNARTIVLNPEKAGSFQAYEQAIETVMNSKGIKTSWINSPNIDSKFLSAFQKIRDAFEKNEMSSLSSLKVALESYFEYFKDADKVENKAKIADEIAKLIKSKPTILRTEIIDRLNQNQEAPSPQQNAEKTITDIAQVLKANKIYDNKNIDKVITILNGLKDNPYIKEFTNGNEYKLIELIAYKIKENVPTDLISNRLTIDAKNYFKLELYPQLQRFNFKTPEEYLKALEAYIKLNTIDGKKLVAGTITEMTLNRANIIIKELQKNNINTIANLKEAMQTFEGLNANPDIQNYTNKNPEILARLIVEQIKEKGENTVDIYKAVKEIAKNGLKDAQIKMLKESKFYETGKRIRAINNLKRLADNNTDDHTINEAIHENTNVIERLIAEITFK